METKWIQSQYLAADVNDILNNFDFPRPIAMALAARGVKTDGIDSFFNNGLNSLSSPYRIPGIIKAAERIWEAIKRAETILIHGDFDVDGITSSALIARVLSQYGANVEVFIPHRLDTGYGFTPASLEKVLEKTKDIGLIITVDCGITSIEAVNEAKKAGTEVIVTDHHESGDELPDAHSILNAKIHSEVEDLHCLAGVGTTFKLAHAFIKYGIENKLIYERFDLKEVLDLVALGTVADIVPLKGENRILAKYGIDVLSKQIRPGVRALCEISRISSLTSEDIAFRVAPHINAAGRLGDPLVAYKLLQTNSIVNAGKLADTLKSYNEERRTKEREIYEEAKQQINDNIKLEENSSIIIYGTNWHQGVIGNVASRIARDYNRATIVLTEIDGIAYGSGRSTANVNLVNILSKCSDLLLRYGGHPMAVGLSLKKENIESLWKRFEGYIQKILSKEDLTPYLEYTGDIFISEINEDFFRHLSKLEPFGHDNPQPVFRLNNLRVAYMTSAGGRHTKGFFKDNNEITISFIIFNQRPSELPPTPWSILAIPQINNFKGNSLPQLRVLDIKSSF